MKLSDVQIRNAKPTGRLVKLSDGDGLQLHITPEGSTLWRLAYRFNGKQKKLSFGRYPAIGLLDARKMRDAARETLARGIDPGVVKKVQKRTAQVAAGNTFSVIADELIAKKGREGKAAVTIAKNEWLLTFARKDLGDRPISQISSAEVLATLQAVERRQKYDTALRLRSIIGQVFRLAIATARADNDPTIALRGALTIPKPKSRAALIEAKHVGGLMRAIDGFDGQTTTRAALQLMALLFPRPGELRLAQWSEFDLEGAVWTIPASRTKMRREHRIPLPRQAIAILKSLHAITGHGKGGLVFPGVRVVTRPISENTMNGALRRLGYDSDQMTAHGFRAMAATLLNESGKWSPDAIERALAHQDENEVRRSYVRGAYWDERQRMGQWWADQLDALKDGAKVLTFPKSAG